MRALRQCAAAARRFILPFAVPLVSAGACLAVSARADDVALEHGRYLAAIAGCAGCHTPRKAGAAPFSGGVAFTSGKTTRLSPNLTPDRETGIGDWTSEQIVTALQRNHRPDGTAIRPPMPQHAYASLTSSDAGAIAAFLKSLPAVHNDLVRSSPDQPVTVSAAPQPQQTFETRGGYLYAAVTHCAECHGPSNGSDQPKSFASGSGMVVAPILSADGMDRYSDAALTRLITAGVRPDGTRLVGPMPVTAYAQLTPDDMTALLAFLRRKR